ncbi:efflux RND transporter permease subunit [Corticibacter populi]|uniref:Efflux pump membrane transporter n=1 Tax=Corticibacter populi TaxID=1550736 RepID=A0A3M6QRG0_9BURK|nr:efflux RND transporter permease subunit [Corticibacter populi]RMX05630.1 efflux RND transporter permease subunit [Corticibacter populi]RZS31097.1 multidrug efflux pump [Corticibacter populi]
MAKFFIDRPIFAWVVALFIIVIGLVSYQQLPVAQYPSVAPPTISISATYPGASAEVLDETVLSVIEREMNGSPGLAYMESSSQANGRGEIVLSFEPGTNADLAQVDVQNRLSQATPRLPAAVTQQGIQVEKASSTFLMVVSLVSTRDDYSAYDLGDYVSRNVLPEIQRVNGVGKAQLFAAERALRIWVDPAKLTGYSLSTADVTAAIAAQNAQVSSGTLGDMPSPETQAIFATVVMQGQLTNAEEFGNIVLRANSDGSTVRLRDVATVELGIESYAFGSRLNGKPAVALGVQLSPTGNAMATAEAVRERMAELEPFFPQGVEWVIPYDTSKFVDISMQQVAHTLIEAIALVFVVMFLFLQNWRYTIIPTIVVPIALLGTLGVLYLAGFSLNVLSMFGMVLVIGIVVDDAIIVVENVERIMSEEGLSPLQASRKAMSQISGAIVGVTLVLIAVFVPLAFFSGSIGNIYRQFAVTMTVSIAFSAFLALSLTPALCATFLKPVVAGHNHAKRGFFGWFNNAFTRTAKGYEGTLAKVLKRSYVMLVVYLAIGAAVAWLYNRLPSSFLPNEDQGFVINSVQLPPGATQHRTLEAIKTAEGFFMEQPEVENVVSILGFSFTGQGQNAALQFVTLKDWSERKGAEHTADAIAGRAMGYLGQVRDAFMYTLSPPPISELGNATGFTFRLQDRSGQGHDALIQARNQLLGMVAQSPVLSGVRPDGLEDAPQLRLEIDRDKANALGVGFASINSTISTALGSSYVNDFPNSGRLQRVMVQAEATARMQPEDLLALTALNSDGAAVPFSAFATTRWVTGPMQVVRYNGYPAVKIAGDAAAGYSTGEAMAEMERLAAQLPQGFGFEWTGQSREEKLAGSTGMILYAFSILAVFLCLAALYESWSIPLAVILVVPLGVLGVVGAVYLHGLPRDVYFQIGLVTIIGLSAKNAILIIEFAKDLQAQGMSAVAAALQAAHLRFRPILMTSLAFTIGVVPLYLASGASSASQRTIGTGVIGGMITGTVLALALVPTFYVVVRSIFKYKPKPEEGAAPPATPLPPAAPAEGTHHV